MFHVDIREGDPDQSKGRRQTQWERVDKDDVRDAIKHAMRSYFVFQQQQTFDRRGRRGTMAPVRQLDEKTIVWGEHLQTKDVTGTIPSTSRGETILFRATPVVQTDGVWGRAPVKDDTLPDPIIVDEDDDECKHGTQGAGTDPTICSVCMGATGKPDQ